MKPNCKLCEKGVGKEGLSSIFGKDFTEKLVYGLFNPEDLQLQRNQKFNVENLIQSHLNEIQKDEEKPIERHAQGSTGQYFKDYYKKIAKLKKAREKAWRDIVRKIKKGELKPSDLPLKQMVENFPEMLADELMKENLLELILERRINENLYERHYAFTPEGQKIIAQKVLEEAFIHLERYGIGIHELNEAGIGIYPSHIIREYDEFLHSYDNLDIQETMILTALRDPVDMKILESDLKARIPLHKTKSSNAIMIDKSGSMYGRKIKGAMMAALGLKELLETNYKEDALHVIAFDYKPYLISPGEITRLKANGSTDIGRALDLAREVLVKEDGNRNIFLITDSEPTVSYYPGQTPVQSAFRASYLAGRENIRMNIIMLDSNPRLRDICDEMAKINGDSTVAFIDDPLNLKEFIIKSFIDHRRKMKLQYLI
ncbi:MAG: VWA domain-containing protein [Nitrososphaerales archaeon]